MKETPIFRNIQHVPRIWGVTYLKLFASLGIGLLIMTVAFALVNRGSALLKIAIIVFAVSGALTFFNIGWRG